ncbi:MAG: hypothetical protein NC517_12550, partial [Firmicutes bacterium]|nr:hypothetical protein [Bacillota bacterium]
INTGVVGAFHPPLPLKSQISALFIYYSIYYGPFQVLFGTKFTLSQDSQSKTPLQATGYQACNAAEHNVLEKHMGI